VISFQALDFISLRSFLIGKRSDCSVSCTLLQPSPWLGGSAALPARPDTMASMLPAKR
jgi:hypothetical protein